MSSARPVMTAGLAVAVVSLGLLGGTSSATAASTPTPSPSLQAPWPEPGAGADGEVAAVSLVGQALTVRPLRQPLVLIEQNVEKTAGTSFTLDANVLFASGESTLTSTATTALTDLTEQIVDAGLTGKATVIGHTDDVGDSASNVTLSKARAKAVLERLTSSLSGKEITLTATGRGESDPLVKNSNDANRSRNRRVSVVFAGTKSVPVDKFDIAVPANTPAQSADSASAPADSLVGVERSLEVGTDKDKWRFRLDVTQAVPVGDMLMIETTTQVLSGASNAFTSYNALFTGNLYATDKHQPAIYDRAAGQLLPVVIDGTGAKLAANDSGWLEKGTNRTSWLLFPQPKAGLGSPVELYLPGFGVLTVPVKA